MNALSHSVEPYPSISTSSQCSFSCVLPNLDVSARFISAAASSRESPVLSQPPRMGLHIDLHLISVDLKNPPRKKRREETLTLNHQFFMRQRVPRSLILIHGFLVRPRVARLILDFVPRVSARFMSFGREILSRFVVGHGSDFCGYSEKETRM